VLDAAHVSCSAQPETKLLPSVAAQDPGCDSSVLLRAVDWHCARQASDATVIADLIVAHESDDVAPFFGGHFCPLRICSIRRLTHSAQRRNLGA
jgi:hypothetical protein